MIPKYITLKPEFREYHDYLQDYIQKKLKSHYENTEIIVSEELLLSHLKDLEQQGILPSIEEPFNEMGMWNVNQNQPGYSLISCIHLGILNGGLAYLSHKYALAIFFMHHQKISDLSIFPYWMQTQGFYGLARHNLAKFLNGVEMKSEEIKNLEEYFRIGEQNIITIPTTWDYLMIPILDSNKKEIKIRVYQITNKEVVNSSHGLEEIPAVKGQFSIWKEFSISKELYIEIIAREITGNIGIAIGRLIYAFQKALRYSQERTQGGRIIYQYPAIQNLLFKADSVIQIAITSLFSLENENFYLSTLLKVFRIKRQIMPLIVQAVSDCLQVHGGYGYMRDYGIEKAYRDVNHIKHIWGTSWEISMFLSELEKENQLIQYM